jgi:hypothetical protein
MGQVLAVVSSDRRKPYGTFRIVPSHKEAATNRSCHQADIIKGHIALIDQSKSGLGLVGGAVKQPEKLLLRIPVAAEIIDEFKTFLLNLFGQIVQIRKQISAGRTFGFEFTFEGHPQRPDLGQNLKPRQEDQEGCNRETDSPVPRRQISKEKRYRQNAEEVFEQSDGSKDRNAMPRTATPNTNIIDESIVQAGSIMAKCYAPLGILQVHQVRNREEIDFQ